MVCNDYKVRGAFMFDEDGNVGYHCFNCGCKAVYRTHHTSFNKSMSIILDAFGIDRQAANRCLFRSFGQAFQPTHAPSKELLHSPRVEMPASFVKLDPVKHVRAMQYIRSRGFDATTADWHVAVPVDNRWKNRVIVPIYNWRNELVFYQGRAHTPGMTKRWESPKIPKTNIIFNHKQIYTNSDSFLVVCEGVFDALSVDGVAIIGSELSAYQINELNKSKRTKVMVPNKDYNGLMLARHWLQLGYHLSFPDIGTATDLNEAYVRFGRLHLEHQIYANACSGLTAELRLGIWCKL